MSVDLDSARDRLMAERLRVTSEMQALQDDLSPIVALIVLGLVYQILANILTNLE